MHYLPIGGKIRSIDHSESSFITLLNDYYGGDAYSLCEHYYEILSGIYEKTGCDVVAHFDLVTKYNEGEKIFDTQNPRYLAAANAALSELIKKPVIFEINTGAIARGYRTSPYPMKNFLDTIMENKKPTILNSDCHNKDFLIESFDKYKHLATLDRLPMRVK